MLFLESLKILSPIYGTVWAHKRAHKGRLFCRKILGAKNDLIKTDFQAEKSPLSN